MSFALFRHVLLMTAVVIVEVIQFWVVSISCCIVCAARAFLPWRALEDDDEMCCCLAYNEFYYKWNETKLHCSFHWSISDKNIYSSLHVIEDAIELLRSNKKWHGTDYFQPLRLHSPLSWVKMQQLLVIKDAFWGFVPWRQCSSTIHYL
jgi:hypothetical protein